jgi:hypothetical protein
MKRNVRTAVILTLLAMMGVACGAQEKVMLSYKAQAGQVIRQKSEGTLNLDASGVKVTVEVQEVQKITIKEVAANGNITMEQERESSDVTVNGQKMPVPDEARSTETITIRPDGTLVSFKSTSQDPEQAKLPARLHPSSNPVFSDKPVGVGDKWSKEIKADDEMGLHAATADYEVLGFEKVGGVDTVKIKMAYRETEGSPPLTGMATLWIEKATGDTVVADYEIENFPLPGGPGGQAMTASGKMHMERIEGSPLPGGTTSTGNTQTKPTPPKEKTIDDIVKDHEKIPGIVTLYRKKEAGRDTLYMELREDQLDKLMMLQVTASTGTGEAVIAGDPINDFVFKFARSGDDKILFFEPNIAFRADENSPIARAVRRSFADAYLDAYKIEAKQPDRKSLLINVSDLFRGDIAQISQALSGGGGIASLLGLPGGTSYSLDREKTYIAAIKNFPENLVIETQYHFTRSGGGRSGLLALLSSTTLADARSIPLRVNYNLFALTDNGFRPRLADSRVGFIYTEFQDFTSDRNFDQMKRYILRWQLEKADSKAVMSPPKRPIVFWLDNAIPLEYRDAVREGILMWNRAFEKTGFKDAIVVKQMPDNADWDHADMRYNTIRWITTQTPQYGAIALFRVNPITGQIVNAGITVDASMMRGIRFEHRKLIEPSVWFNAKIEPFARPLYPFRCDMAEQALDQAWFGWMALNMVAPSGTQPDEKAYTHAFLRSIICHEMGHILGLFHNFEASTYHTLDELKNPELIRKTGVVASVMDYFPFNIAALKRKNVDYWTTTVGPYDIWAMQYGYVPIDAKTPEGELPRLRAIASRCNEPGLAYHNDLVADRFDPDVTRFDLGRDPLAYWTRNLQVTRYLLLSLAQRSPKKGESYWEFTRDFNMGLNLYARAAATAQRYVGGLYLHANYRGDKGEKPALIPVDAAKQRQALQLLNTYIFAENAFSLPKSYYTKLTADPFPSLSSFLSSGETMRQDFPVRDQMAAIQQGALRRLFATDVLQRVVNNEFKIGDDSKALTLPYLFHSVGATVWSELDGRRNIGSLRRQLQRAYLDLMIDMCVRPSAGMPDDAKMLAWDQLRTLKAKLTAARRHRLDDYTRVHLDESLMRVNRALDAKQMISGPPAPATSLLQQLLGEDAKR